MLAGACTASLQPNLPRPNIATGQVMDCAGMWSDIKTRIEGSCSGAATSSSTLGLYGLGQFAALTCDQSAHTLGRPMKAAGTIRYLGVAVSVAGTSASSGVFTVVKNGSDQTMTCTVGTGTSCSDSTHVFSFAAGDVIAIKFTTQSGDCLAGVTAYLVVD